MSHFSVLVINTNGHYDVEESLAPFSEELEVEFEDCTYEVRDSWEEFSALDKERYDNSFHDFALDYYGYNELNGKYGYWTNPDGKWDWWVVGGRWGNMIPCKDGSRVDKACIKDIDMNIFKCDPKVYAESLRFWELYVEQKPAESASDKKLIEFVLYNKEWFVDRYHTKEEYANQTSAFATYAVIKDGEWIGRGEMGWFGSSTETNEEGYKWDETYFENFIANLPENAYITVVDCHC
jgi:hypothetical protein